MASNQIAFNETDFQPKSRTPGSVLPATSKFSILVLVCWSLVTTDRDVMRSVQHLQPAMRIMAQHYYPMVQT